MGSLHLSLIDINMKSLITLSLVVTFSNLSLQFYSPPIQRAAPPPEPVCRQVPKEVCNQVPKTTYESVTKKQCRNVPDTVCADVQERKCQRQSENMLVRPNGDGTYSANWTPGNVGWYRLSVLLDGCELPAVHKVEVIDPPQGKLPPSQTKRTCPTGEINRLRQFIAKPSAGLRIRLHPTLQSEQIGIVPVDGTLTIVDELSNSDGVWVRLSQESMSEYCTSTSAPEGWALQYNQHYDKMLLKPITEPP